MRQYLQIVRLADDQQFTGFAVEIGSEGPVEFASCSISQFRKLATLLVLPNSQPVDYMDTRSDEYDR
jgi:hypothetical protein